MGPLAQDGTLKAVPAARAKSRLAARERSEHAAVMSDSKPQYLGTDTVASNPGHISVKRLRWCMHRPLWPLVWGLPVVLSFVGIVFHHWAWVIPGMPFVLVLRWYFTRLSEHFHFGNANPGLLVSISPMRVAVLADLSKGSGFYPAIKITEARVPLVGNRKPVVGARIATVALYNDRQPNAPYWSDFQPIPVDYVTDNIAEIESLMSTFCQADWEELIDGLDQLPKPLQVGLFPLQWDEPADRVEH